MISGNIEKVKNNNNMEMDLKGRRVVFASRLNEFCKIIHSLVDLPANY